MLQDREKLYQAYHTLLSMALSWALALAVNQYYELRVPAFLSALFSILPALLIYLFDINRKNTIIYLVIASIFPILALIFWVRRFNPLHWLWDFISYVARYDGSKELYAAGYSNFVIILVGFFGALLFFLLTKRQILKIILAGTVFAAMIILSISKFNIGKAVVGICIFYMLSILVECCGIIYAARTGKKEKKESILYLAPVCLLLAILAAALPSRPDPIEWRAFKYIYNNVKEQIEIWKTDLDYYFSRQNGEFFISLTGYSEDGGELGRDGGGLVKDDKVAMKVSGSAKNGAVYLIGSVSDIYTGYGWEKSRKDYLEGESEYFLDYMELAYALLRQAPEVLENNRFIEREALKVQFNNIKTKTFFYPLKTSRYNFLSRTRRLLDDPSNITFGKAQGRGTFYETVYYEMNLQGDAFVRMLRDADSFSYDNPQSVGLDSLEWLRANALAQDSASLMSGGGFYEQLGERADIIKAKDTGLPESLPMRVKELAREITADCDTTYDKLKAMEAYLQGYTYTLSPEKVPEGRDFADYFLFESREGYCTAYATAMAVLARCIGVPTRYVEGYVAKFEDGDENGMYPVKNSQAHAWAEAYIEGVGWIPFEATAPFYNVRYTKWADSKKEGEAGFADPYEQYMHGAPGASAGEEPAAAAKEEDGGTENIVNTLLVSLAAVLIISLLIIAYYNVLKYRYRRTYNKADNSRKMYMMFLRILSLLKREGFELKEQETILMLSQRVKDRFRYNRIIFSDIANIFMRYRYAQEETTKTELDKVAAYQRGLADSRKGKQSGFKIWLSEFLFLMKNRNT